MRAVVVLGLIAVAAAAASSADAQQVLSREPARGGLRYGEKVLVNDGKCPRGQVREVSGGTIPSRGGRRPTAASTPRERRCVPRPS